AAFLAQAPGERLVSSALHENAEVVTDLLGADDLDDVPIAQLGEDFGFVLEPVVVLGVDGELEDLLLAVACHEIGDCSAAAAESLLDDETVAEGVASAGFDHVRD